MPCNILVDILQSSNLNNSDLFCQAMQCLVDILILVSIQVNGRSHKHILKCALKNCKKRLLSLKLVLFRTLEVLTQQIAASFVQVER